MEIQIETTRVTKMNKIVWQFQMLSNDVKQMESSYSPGESINWDIATLENGWSGCTKTALAHNLGLSSSIP